MARGQAAAANAQLATTNAAAQNQGQQAQALENQLTPGYTSLMNTGYFDPAEQAAATTSEMGAAAAPFQSAQFRANNTAAATNNASGQAANADALALEQGQAAGGAAANLQNQTMQNQLAGAYGLTGLEQGNQQTMANLYGLGPGTLQARAAGQSGGQEALGWTNAALGALK